MAAWNARAWFLLAIAVTIQAIITDSEYAPHSYATHSQLAQNSTPSIDNRPFIKISEENQKVSDDIQRDVCAFIEWIKTPAAATAENRALLSRLEKARPQMVRRCVPARCIQGMQEHLSGATTLSGCKPLNKRLPPSQPTQRLSPLQHRPPATPKPRPVTQERYRPRPTFKPPTRIPEHRPLPPVQIRPPAGPREFKRSALEYEPIDTRGLLPPPMTTRPFTSPQTPAPVTTPPQTVIQTVIREIRPPPCGPTCVLALADILRQQNVIKNIPASAPLQPLQSAPQTPASFRAPHQQTALQYQPQPYSAPQQPQSPGTSQISSTDLQIGLLKLLLEKIVERGAGSEVLSTRKGGVPPKSIAKSLNGSLTSSSSSKQSSKAVPSKTVTITTTVAIPKNNQQMKENRAHSAQGCRDAEDIRQKNTESCAQGTSDKEDTDSDLNDTDNGLIWKALKAIAQRAGIGEDNLKTSALVPESLKSVFFAPDKESSLLPHPYRQNHPRKKKPERPPRPLTVAVDKLADFASKHSAIENQLEEALAELKALSVEEQRKAAEQEKAQATPPKPAQPSKKPYKKPAKLPKPLKTTKSVQTQNITSKVFSETSSSIHALSEAVKTAPLPASAASPQISIAASQSLPLPGSTAALQAPASIAEAAHTAKPLVATTIKILEKKIGEVSTTTASATPAVDIAGAKPSKSEQPAITKLESDLQKKSLNTQISAVPATSAVAQSIAPAISNIQEEARTAANSSVLASFGLPKSISDSPLSVTSTVANPGVPSSISLPKAEVLSNAQSQARPAKPTSSEVSQTSFNASKAASSPSQALTVDSPVPAQPCHPHCRAKPKLKSAEIRLEDIRDGQKHYINITLPLDEFQRVIDESAS